jgi:hypothetical protein
MPTESAGDKAAEERKKKGAKIKKDKSDGDAKSGGDKK